MSERGPTQREVVEETRARAWPALATGVVVGLLLLTIVSEPGSACICVQRSEDEARRVATRKAAAIFVGEVLETSLDHTWFQVYTSWRGLPRGNIVVDVHGDQSSCFARFEKGARYLVYARGRGGPEGTRRLIVSMCDRIVRAAESEEDRQRLGEPEWGLEARPRGGSVAVSPTPPTW